MPQDASSAAFLAGKVALVTGSSSGIGAAIAEAFASAGAHVMVNSSSSIAAGEALARKLPGAAYIQADVAKEEEAEHLVSSAVELFGRLDIVVNNAGTTEFIAHADTDAVTAEVWQRILGVNLIGAWSVTRAAVPFLRAAGDGLVINITSVSGIRPLNSSSIPYAASKAALNHTTQLLARALGPEIRVNAVAPGLVVTPWSSGWDDAFAYVNENVALRRAGQPSDVADVCLMLARSGYVTGAVIAVDGGLALT